MIMKQINPDNESVPVEAQDVETTKLLTSRQTAESFFNLENQEYDIPILLTNFINQFKKRETKNLGQLTNAKNILLRHQIEKMVEKDGRFNLDGLIPFKNVCMSCQGSGERYKFFRDTMPVNCKFCDVDENTKPIGKLTVKCRSCHGTGKYNNHICTTCKDPNTNKSTGYVRIKCRNCRGTGTYYKLVIDSKLKSTTYCRRCKGRGFILPETEPKKITPIINPVISKDIGQKIKSTVIK